MVKKKAIRKRSQNKRTRKVIQKAPSKGLRYIKILVLTELKYSQRVPQYWPVAFDIHE